MACLPEIAAIDAVCAFERFYEKRLREFYKASLVHESSWAEIGVIKQLERYGASGASASCVRSRLSLDSGYVCRVMKGLDQRGLVSSIPDPSDRRRQCFALTERGKKVAVAIHDFHRERVAACLLNIAPSRLRKLVAAMTYIQHILTRSPIDHLIESYEPRRMRVATRRVRARPRPSSPRRRG